MEKKGKDYFPTQLEKRLLVWFKRYPSLKDVPDHVSLATMEKIKNKARIRVNLILVGAFSVAFIVTCFSAKREMKKGNKDIYQQNIDWHKAYNDPANIDLKIPEMKR